jgi:D-glycero-alpha-D-manno-heptose 1-phosphate guanylyltransferase
MQSIILAGGLGTRLRSVLGEDLPKCMAPVAGKPFLHYILESLAQQRATSVILSLGYKWEAVEEYLEEGPAWPFEIDLAIEEAPLGTGGAIRECLEEAGAEHVVILNGDTFFNVPLKDLIEQHAAGGAETTLALKPMKDFERYGVVALDDKGLITGFEEKRPRAEGIINGGVYCIDREAFLRRKLPRKFSFEKEYLEVVAPEGVLRGIVREDYFIDIGVPEDFDRAQQDFNAGQLPA